MFTGIVETVGRVRAVQPLETGRRFTIDTRFAPELNAGDSVAIDGVCTTVVGLDRDGFAVEAIGTTLSRTILREYEPGRAVNLERALRLGDHLGGHLVQGHVDGVGTVAGVARDGEHVLLDVRLPDVVAEVTVLYGSLAINGVSLTVNRLLPGDVAQVALIPFTLEHTDLSALRPGDAVNLEGDMIGKFVAQLVKRRATSGVEPAEAR